MHIGLIMDGNGRWATKRSLPRAAGHLEGLKAAKRVVLAAIRLRIDYLTFYVFSTENWKRPSQEINYLMGLLAKKLPGEIGMLRDNDIRVLFRGNIDALPEEARQGVLKTRRACEDASEHRKQPRGGNRKIQLNIAQASHFNLDSITIP